MRERVKSGESDLDGQLSLIGCVEDAEFTWIRPFDKSQGRLVRRSALRHAPGVQRDRVRAVKAAFLKVLKDPEFVAEAEKRE